MKSKTILFLFSLFISLFVAAASVSAFYYEINHFYDNTTIPATNSISNVQALVYNCADDECSDLNSASIPWFNQNSGANTYNIVPYPSTPSISYYGEYFFKSCYLPKQYITWSYGDGSLDYNIMFNKGKNCHAPITQLSVQNVNYPNMPIAIHLNTSIGSDVFSPFALSGLGPAYVPDAYKAEFYSAETRVVLNIYNQSGSIVHSETRMLNLYAGTVANLEFFWTPTVVGNYTVVAATTVTDCQCSSQFDESAFKQFTVISQIPPAENMCYTLLNNLTIDNPFPIAGRPLLFSLRALSDFFNSTNLALTPVPTFLDIRIYNSTNNLVNLNTALVPGVFSNVFNVFNYSWTPQYSDQYSISVTGIAQSSLCSGLTNLPETIGQTVFVNPPTPPPVEPLTVSIIGGPLSGNAPLTTFLNASASSGCAITAYAWGFDDGTSGSSQNVVHTYNLPRIYNPEVVVFDSCGRNASASVTVNVSSVPPPPPPANLTVFIVGGPFSGNVPLTVDADAVASSGCIVTSYFWSFGDSGSSLARNITHVYTVVGTYVLNVTAFDSCGRSASDSRIVSVNSVPPVEPLTVSIIGGPLSGNAPLTTFLNASASSGCAITAYAWGFDDGTSGSSQNVVHTYNSVGVYNASVVVFDSCGRNASASVTVNVSSVPPVANLTVSIIGGPLSGNAPLTTYLNASASSGCAILFYNWNLGDGSSSFSQNVVHTYNSVGVYNPEVVVFDSCGRNASASVTVNVSSVPPPPLANLSVYIVAAPSSGIAPLLVNFNAVASSTCSVVSYNWNFGDNSSGIGQFISHVFNSVGNYFVSVFVTDACGRTASNSTVISATQIPPVPHAPKIISIPPTKVEEPSPTRFNATYKYQVVAVDPDNDTLFYYLSAAPDGMFIDSGTGLITWTPTRRQLGYNLVAVVVSDGFLTDNQSYTILVTVPGEDTRPKEKLQFTQISIFNTNECVAPGSTLSLAVGIKNNGYFSMKYTSIIASVPELGLRDKHGPFDLDSDETAVKNLYLDIPINIPDGFYYLRIYAGDSVYQRIEYREFAVAKDCNLFLGCNERCSPYNTCTGACPEYLTCKKQ